VKLFRKTFTWPKSKWIPMGRAVSLRFLNK
jgi:hypothetical protein